MTIGEKIKLLRQKNDVTQEKLAEYLNITYQSVSKWENGNALPDISLVVPLANFFGVSIDILFDRDSKAEEKEVEDAIRTTQHNDNKGLYDENLVLWRNMVHKYPKNYRCLEFLAGALTQLYHGANTDKRDELAAEIIAICERILRDCTDNSIRDSAIQTLVYFYSDRRLSAADESKAIKYAETASSIMTCREFLLISAYFSEENREKAKALRHFTCLDLLNFLCGLLFNPCGTTEEKINATQTALKLWSIVIDDGNYLFYNWKIADYHETLAELYAQLGKRGEVIANLKQALYYADRMDHLPIGESYYTAILISSASCNILENVESGSKSQVESITEDIKKKSCYDFLHGDDEFIILLNTREININ